MSNIQVALVGGTGYTGAELIRFLIAHPHAQLTHVTSRSEAGRSLSSFFPHLPGLDPKLVFYSPESPMPQGVELVFFATPHTTAMARVPGLLEQGKRVIDLSADFRLKDPAVWQHWYGVPHGCPELLSEAVYGLPEVNRCKIKQARLVANPGCYPTAVQLGLMPLLQAGIVNHSDLIADCKSGVSGAGRDPKRTGLLCEASENFAAYAVSGHRHWPEIQQGIGALVPDTSMLTPAITFVPHLTPMIRGLQATIYAKLNEDRVNMDEQALHALYLSYFEQEPFVDVMPLGMYPSTASVKGQNLCRLAIFKTGERQLVVLSVIDNLVKGAAGQAIQNMNILYGWPESTGLAQAQYWP